MNVPSAGITVRLASLLDGIPASVAFLPVASSTMVAQDRARYTMTKCGGPQIVQVIGVDAGGSYILGPGAPASSLTTSSRQLTILPASRTSQNTFVVTRPISSASSSASLTAMVTPLAASGGTPVSETVPVTLKGGRGICGVWTSWPLKKGSIPEYIVSGPDKALWFTENGSGKIGRITTTGSITNEYPIPTVSSHPEGITVGPDGAIWFAEFYGNKVGRITTAGTMTEYPVNDYQEDYTGMAAKSIVFAKDSRLFITGILTSNYGDDAALAAMNINGSYSSETFAILNDAPNQITRAPNGSSSLWFTTGFGIARTTLGGTITQLQIGALPDPCLGPDYEGITAGPDGAIWYTDANCGAINRQPTNLTAGTTYKVSEWAAPWGITTGPDGALWFAESSGLPGTIGKIGRITTDGVITEYPTEGDSVTYGVTLGPDGALWFTEFTKNGDRIGRLQ